MQEIKSSLLLGDSRKWRLTEGINKTAHLKFERVSAVVYSCFVLHSFCEPKNYSGLDKDEVEAQIMRHRLEEQNNINLPDFIYSNNTTEGEYI